MRIALVAASMIALAIPAFANDVTVPMKKVTAEGIGEEIGTIVIKPKGNGVEMVLAVKDIPAGEHGFHVHEKGDCSPAVKDGKAVAALAAGAHYDPAGTKAHKGPGGGGHKGDMPLLVATDEGVNETIVVENVSLADIAGRSLMIHEGGDNYTDNPANGGGAARIACGVIPK